MVWFKNYCLSVNCTSPDKHSIGPRRRQTSAEVKREIIKKAKELPCYFAEIFKVKVVSLSPVYINHRHCS